MVTTISPDRLKELLDADEEFALVDTRTEESYEAWHVRGAVNYPFGATEELESNGQLEEVQELVGDADRVVAICGKGITSGNLASQLAETTDAFEVRAVDGGMKAWSGVYDAVAVDVGDGATVVQLQRRAKGCLSYVVGCEETGEAVVVDPTADVDEVTAAAGGVGLSIVGVIDTHVHADHVSGGTRLADELDVPYYLPERARERDVAYDYEPLARNEVLEVGDLAVKALAAPGHTSEMANLLVDDRAVLTADTLHVDSVGRTELEFGADDDAPRAAEGASGGAASSSAEEGASGGEAGTSSAEEGASGEAASGGRGARMLHETLHRTILAEPESVRVLPGHVTVTADGEFEVGRPGEPIATTIREARTGIDVLQLDEEAFVDRLADPGEEPANYEEIIEINRGASELEPEERTELELGPNNCSA